MLNYIQDRITFKPNPDYDPQRIPQDCQVKTIEGQGRSITLAYKLTDSPVIAINCHGNSSNISNLPGVYDFYNQTGFSYILFDYPGYGNSSGKPSEENCYIALDLVVEFVRDQLKFDYSKMVLHGISLGGAIAIEGLTKYPVSCGVIDSTISNNIEMAKFMYPRLPLWRFLTPRFDSINKVARIETPILFFHGIEDEVIPFAMSENLHALKSGSKELVLLPEIKHVDLLKVTSPEIIQKFRDFVNQNQKT